MKWIKIWLVFHLFIFFRKPRKTKGLEESIKEFTVLSLTNQKHLLQAFLSVLPLNEKRVSDNLQKTRDNLKRTTFCQIAENTVRTRKIHDFRDILINNHIEGLHSINPYILLFLTQLR